MADRQHLTSRTESEETRVVCDRAVFTSLRSPTGEGYRVVAASSGLRAQERTEITRRSPSHGALCSAASDARGVAISKLSSGRVCVSLSRFAGAEHTGRGGRVWTDALLVEPGDFLRAGGHPGIFAGGVDSAPLPTVGLGSSIDKLALSLPAPGEWVQSRPEMAERVRLGDVAVLAALVVERCPCVVAVADPVVALEAALALLPLALRGDLNVSAGLRFANSRQVTLCAVDSIDLDVRRATRGRPVALVVADAQHRRTQGALDPWLVLMTRWWAEGRAVEAAVLADSLRADWSLREILEVARVCEAIDRSEEQPEALEALLARRAAA